MFALAVTITTHKFEFGLRIVIQTILWIAGCFRFILSHVISVQQICIKIKLRRRRTRPSENSANHFVLWWLFDIYSTGFFSYSDRWTKHRGDCTIECIQNHFLNMRFILQKYLISEERFQRMFVLKSFCLLDTQYVTYQVAKICKYE